MASKTPRAKTFEEVFPATLPASDTPPIHNTIVENHIAPFYALGWRFAEFDLHRHFDAQSEWDKTYNPMCDSQSAWVNPRWRQYAKELPERRAENDAFLEQFLIDKISYSVRDRSYLTKYIRLGRILHMG
ncbi:hypothetical protein BDZ89DRAFT_407092 [Hymenopellis radicata]|nr:hypothetical protein BDZ89DRAFT_407092 [Hymenopellis radicata]